MNQFPQGELFHSQQRFLAHEHEVVQAINERIKRAQIGSKIKRVKEKERHRER